MGWVATISLISHASACASKEVGASLSEAMRRAEERAFRNVKEAGLHAVLELMEQH